MIGEFQQKRLIKLCINMLWACVVVFCFYMAFADQVHAYITPKQIIEQQKATGNNERKHIYRLGAMVEKNSLKTKDGTIIFTAVDHEDESFSIKVRYKGAELPALFKEGEMMLAEGKIHEGRFEAFRILAKHDEYYQPKIKKAVNDDQ